MVSKIFSRSRGLESSVKLSKPNSAGDAGADERAERRRRHVRHLAQQVDVFGMVRELVVADQRPIGFAAGSAELVLVQLLEGLALVELNRSIEVLEQLPLGNVHYLQLQLGAGLAVHHQVVQTAPRTFELLERRGVHDRH